MIFIRRLLVGDRERVLMTQKNRFARILTPGEYWIWTLGRSVQFEKHNVDQIVFVSEWANYLAKEKRELAQRLFTIVETNDTQVAAVYFDGKLSTVIGPASRVLFWRGVVEVTFRIFNAREELEVPAEILAPVTRIASRFVTFVVVDEGKTGLVYVNGRYVKSIAPGPYGFWNATGTVRVEIVDQRLQTMEISGQEILTNDKVSIRVNVWAEYQIIDALKAAQTLKDANAHLYRTLQMAARQTLGKRTLEQILEVKVDIDEAAASGVRTEMETFGIKVGSMAIKDIILPGEMREILNQVVTAEKQAQANLIRRREETAATRSLLNTARLMESSPLLIRMKELETIEKIAEKVAKITVHGGFDSLLKQLLIAREQQNSE